VQDSTRILVVALLSLVLCASSGDPGLLLELDREGYVLEARDLRDGSLGPSLRVALGSPAHQTPSGAFPLYQVVRDPAWKPGEEALARGAQPQPASPDGPMGVAKLPFGAGGYAVHGGGHPALLGKPVSLGCVRTADPDLLRLLGWLESRDALGPAVRQPDGERHQAFLRPARLLIR
jgi:hypothetical protein